MASPSVRIPCRSSCSGEGGEPLGRLNCGLLKGGCACLCKHPQDPEGNITKIKAPRNVDRFYLFRLDRFVMKIPGSERAPLCQGHNQPITGAWMGMESL